MLLILLLDIIFVLFILDGHWTISLGNEWEVPLGGWNHIPPRHLGFYLLVYTLFAIPFIFLQHSHPLHIICNPFYLLPIPPSPLHFLQALLLSCTSQSPFIFLALIYVNIYTYIHTHTHTHIYIYIYIISRHQKKKRFSIFLFKWCLKPPLGHNMCMSHKSGDGIRTPTSLCWRIHKVWRGLDSIWGVKKINK